MPCRPLERVWTRRFSLTALMYCDTRLRYSVAMVRTANTHDETSEPPPQTSKHTLTISRDCLLTVERNFSEELDIEALNAQHHPRRRASVLDGKRFPESRSLLRIRGQQDLQARKNTPYELLVGV
ncbi:unnamed protein product [Nesidiocoris tenuis]|uniref:Uncharacterized protein n=1 Tax=Nesidiocoris tenuis TaxID=355587 RepID=A0A6H5GLS4_9HEMI|nr:unnamed protein product [Nesidiocoris tenuis]